MISTNKNPRDLNIQHSDKTIFTIFNDFHQNLLQAEVALTRYEEVANVAAGEGVDLVTKVIENHIFVSYILIYNIYRQFKLYIYLKIFISILSPK